MDGSAFADDPVELRIRLEVALEYIEVLEAEIAELKARTQAPASSPIPPAAASPKSLSTDMHPADEVLPRADHSSPPEAKIALFRALFMGRQDIYARRWTSAKTGKSGWSPAEPFGSKDLPANERVFLPLTDSVIARHLGRTQPGDRPLHAGLYPMLEGDMCRLLACDFDDAEWREDARAYQAAAQAAGIDAALEISRSGEGAHVWIFFTAPLPAQSARNLGFALLRRAMASRGQMKLSSYDRFFPSQDLLPDKAPGGFRFGNLIALPLNGDARANGTTVFCEPATLEPHPDQFAYLSRLDRLSPDRVEKLVRGLGEVTAGPDDTTPGAGMPAKPRRSRLSGAPEFVAARMNAMLEINTRDLPAALIAALKHAASLRNPEFYWRQAQRYSTYGTPRFVCCFDETDPGWLRVPRGLADVASELVRAAGGTLQITSGAPATPPLDLRFTGTLSTAQQSAVEALADFERGVLVAPTGAGKTVMACALVAHHSTPTAILVPTQELMAQWRESLTRFLGLPPERIGVLGGGKHRRTGQTDVIMLPTLARRDPDDALLDGYGLVVVDECQCLGGAATYAAITRVNVSKWLGLSATPYRADKLDGLITFACGPIRHTIEPTRSIPQYVVTHATSFVSGQTDKAISYPELYNELAADPARNQQIVADVTAAAGRDRRTLVLSNRIEHISALAEALRGMGIEPLLLHGALPPEERSAIRQRLSDGIDAPYVLLAIDKIATEGLDLPDLDTLVIASPTSFKGKVIQQIGRIQRAHSAKRDIEVHDYLDAAVPALVRMHAKRRKTLALAGFQPITAHELSQPAQDANAFRTRPVSKARPNESRVSGTSSVVGAEATAIRAWARANGYDVADRGRISAEIREAYRTHHTAQPDN